MSNKSPDPKKLTAAITALDPNNDDHWTKAGQPDLNHLKEALGQKVTRKHLEEAGLHTIKRADAPIPLDSAGGNAPEGDGPAPEGDPAADPEGAGEPDATGDDAGEDAGEDGDQNDSPDPEGDDAEETKAEAVADVLDDKPPASVVNMENGEPTISHEQASMIFANPGKFQPDEIGAAVIKALDFIVLGMTVEAKRRQPELAEVFQLYAAERPTILERQKRLAIRRANEDRAVADSAES